MVGIQGKAGDAVAVAADPTSPALIVLKHHRVEPALQAFVTTIFTLRCDEPRIGDLLPAAVGYLVVVLEGSGVVRFATGRVDPVRPVALLTPTNAAVALEVDGPLYLVAAALSPLGWAALTALDAGEHADCMVDAAAVFGSDAAMLGERCLGLRREGPDDPERLVSEIASFVAARLRSVAPRHARLIGQVGEWLSSGFDPDLAKLQRATGYSSRQLQRLSVRYFGTGPKQLARKYRALRVAALLQSDETGDERAAELIDLFYDQSHLIRELRHFLGRTPARLGKEGDSLLGAASGLRNYREFRPNVARIPGD